MKILTRKQAKESKLPRYFTGVPCAKGHTSERFTSNGMCVACSKEYVESNKDKVNEWNRSRNNRRRDYIRKHNQKYYLENKDKIREAGKIYYIKNKKRINKRQAQWQKDNPEKCRAINAKRRSAKLQRTPIWADLQAIKEFYEKCPKGMEVDHIIPLQGELVSGLHVLENLQYLTKSENSRKQNRYPLDELAE